jgi:hypothetical protein
MDWTAQQFDPTLDWEKIKQIKDEWGGKVILKGILDAEDAKMALNVGAGCDYRVKPRRTPVGWRTELNQGPTCDFGCGGG